MKAFSRAKGWVRTWQDERTRQTLYDQVHNFRCRIPVYIESDGFIVRAAENGADLLRVLNLRHDVFYREWQGRNLKLGLDIDGYDLQADHLLIIDRARDEVVGTYRLLCTRYVDQFYSQNEFRLDGFLSQPGHKLELGRACIHEHYRDGNTIDLLWKGLARYIELSRVRYLFGCASIKVSAPEVAALIGHLIDKEQWLQQYDIAPTSKYRREPLVLEGSGALSPAVVRDLLPPLLRSYLHAGAKVFGAPAYDAEFSCYDLLTILDLQQLHPKFRLRYFARPMTFEPSSRFLALADSGSK